MSTTRKVPRHEFSVSANLHPARGEFTAVTVRDISMLGCQVEHAKAPKVGKVCELYFEWQGTMVGVEALVVWGDPKGRAGLKYQRVDAHSQKCLQELCTSLQVQQLKGRRGGDLNADEARVEAKFEWTEHPMFRSVPEAIPKPADDLERSRRKLPRYVSELRGDVLISASGKNSDVLLIDLSVSGARLEGTELPNTGEFCQLRTEWDGVRILLPGKVVWKTKKQAGLKFASLDDATARQLRDICASLLILPPGLRD